MTYLTETSAQIDHLGPSPNVLNLFVEEDPVEPDGPYLSCHALDSSLHQTQQHSFLLRVIENGYSLEIRAVSLVENPNQTLVPSPLILNFPARLARGTFLVEYEAAQNVFIVLALSEPGTLYRLALTINDASGTLELLGQHLEFPIPQISNSNNVDPLFLHVVDENSMIVSCTDNSLLHVNFDSSFKNHQDAYTITELKEKQFFGFASRLSSLTISLASNSHGSGLLPYLFGVTNDRQLIAWSLTNNFLEKSILFPLPNAEHPGTAEPLPGQPQRLVRFIETQDEQQQQQQEYSGLVFTYVPGRDSFVVFQAVPDVHGKLASLDSVGEYVQPEETLGLQLVDFDVSNDKLWATWVNGEETMVWLADLPRQGLLDLDDSPPDLQPVWSLISPRKATNATAEAFDQLLAQKSLSLTETFIKHLFYPGRYSPSVLQEALEEYIETSGLQIPDSDLDNHDLCTNIITTVDQSKPEWLRFVAIADQYQRQSLYPLSLSIDQNTDYPLVIKRNALTTVVRSDPQFPQNSFTKAGQRLLELIPISTFTNDITPTLVTPPTFSISEIAADLYQRFVSTYEQDPTLDELATDIEQRASELIDIIRSLLGWLARSEGEVEVIPEEGGPASILTTLWLVDYCQQSVEDRFEKAKILILALVFVAGDDDLVQAIDGWDQILSQSFATFHRLQILNWIVTCPEVPPLTDQSRELEDKFDRLGVLEGKSFDFNKSLTVNTSSEIPSVSLLHFHIRQREIVIPLDLPSYDALSSVVLPIIKPVLKPSILVTKKDIDFVQSLKDRPSLVSHVVDMWPRDVALEFLRASAELALGRSDEAKEAFDHAAIAFYDPSNISEELAYLVPAQNLHEYYANVVSIVESGSGVQELVAHFCDRAIESSYQEDGDSADTDSSFVSQSDKIPSLRSLWLKQFRALTFLGRYREAYQNLMSMPHQDMKTDSLRHLVTSMCESGNVALLISFDFPRFQTELENILAFRCRNSMPNSEPDYYRITYAYYIKMGKYQAAAEVMYRHACRIGDLLLKSDNFIDLLTRQSQSLLASINALSLLDPKSAWFSVQDVKDDSRKKRRKKRRKIAYLFRPNTEQPNDLDIVDIDEVRCDYTVSMGRLLLAREMPELAKSYALQDPRDLVMVFAQGGKIDMAFSTAASQNVDMQDLFRYVATKCVRLSTSKVTESSDASWVYQDTEASLWDNDTISKAWSLLHLHIQRHDQTGRNRAVVLDAILQEDPGSSLPHWLVSYFFEKAPDELIRKLIKHDRYADAFVHSINLVRRVQKLEEASLTGTIKPADTCLPWTLFDDLLSLDLSGNGLDKDLLQEIIPLRPLHKELEQVIKSRLDWAKQANKALRTQAGF